MKLSPSLSVSDVIVSDGKAIRVCKCFLKADHYQEPLKDLLVQVRDATNILTFQPSTHTHTHAHTQTIVFLSE